MAPKPTIAELREKKKENGAYQHGYYYRSEGMLFLRFG